jgi:cytochrome c peroxidase
MRVLCAQPDRRWIMRLTIVACIGSFAVAAVVHSLAESLDGEPITPIPAAEALEPAKIELGRRMFHDLRLSRGDRVSCATCHDLARGGDDGRARSETSDGGRSDFNASTVFNAALNARLNWRGNFRTLAEQNEAVLLDPRLLTIRPTGLSSPVDNDRQDFTIYSGTLGVVAINGMSPRDA